MRQTLLFAAVVLCLQGYITDGKTNSPGPTTQAPRILSSTKTGSPGPTTQAPRILSSTKTGSPGPTTQAPRILRPTKTGSPGPTTQAPRIHSSTKTGSPRPITQRPRPTILGSLRTTTPGGQQPAKRKGNARKPFAKLPNGLNQPKNRLDRSNLKKFRDSLDKSRQETFDDMSTGRSAFQVTGKNPKDIQKGAEDMANLKNRTRYMLSNNNFTGLRASDFDKMTGSILGNLKSESLDAMNASLSTDERIKVCEKFLKTRITGPLKTLLQKFQCLDAIKDSNITKGASRSQKQVLAKVLRENKKDPSKWTSDEAKIAMESGDPKRSEIDGLSTKTVNDMINKGVFQKDIGKLSKDALNATCDKVKRAYAGNDWKNLKSKDRVAKIGGIISKCPDAISKIPVTVAASALAKQARSMSKTERRKIAKNLPSTDKWSLEEAKERLEFIKDDRKKLEDLSDNNVIGLLGDDSSRKSINEMNDKDVGRMKKRILKMRKYKKANRLDASGMQKLPKSVIGKLSASYLKGVNCTVIAATLHIMKDVRFETKAQKKNIIMRCRTELDIEPSSMTRDKIEKLGELMDAFDSDNIGQMPAAEISAAKSALAKTDFSKENGKAILQRMRDNGDNLSGQCGSLGKLRKNMKQSEKTSCSPADLGLDDTSKTPDLEGLDVPIVIKQLSRHIKNIGGSSMLSANDFARLAKVLAKGMSKSDIDDLPVNSDLPDKVEAVLAEEDDMDSPLISKCGQKAKDFIDSIGVNNLVSSTASKIAPAFKHYKNKDEEFEANTPNNEVRQKMCNIFAASNTAVQTQEEREKQFNKCLKYRPDPNDSTKVVDKSAGGSIESGDIQDLDNLLDGITKEVIERLDIDGATSEDNIQRLCRANAKPSTRVKLLTKLREKGDLFTDTVKSSQLGGCHCEMSADDYNKISDSDAEEICEDLLADYEKKEIAIKKRADRGFKDEMTDIKSKIRLVKKCLPAILAVNNAGTSRRRKRATTTTLTCDDLTPLGSGVTGITAEQIGTLSNSEFEDCIENMNKYTGWTSDRRSAFASKAKSAWGSTVSSWSAEQVRLGGSIVASGLSEAEIRTLNLGTSEAASSVGATNYYTAAQLKELFTRFLVTHSVQTNTMSADQLSSLGNLACGATDTQIASFSNNAVKDAIESFSELTSCEPLQMMAYGNHAKTAFGTVSSWDTSIIVSVGTMIGGIGNDISQLNGDQIGALKAMVIAAIPPNTFAKFTPSQLSGFSAGQANAVTSSQQSALNSDQMEKLKGAGATTKTVGSGAIRTTQASLLLIIAAVLFNQNGGFAICSNN